MKILYLGSRNGTSSYRANALLRLGHEVRLLDPNEFISGVPLAGAWQRYLGAVGLVSKVRRGIVHRINEFKLRPHLGGFRRVGAARTGGGTEEGCTSDN